MSIYTKTGDKGTTSLFTGQRVKKFHPRVETYGTLDELNAVLSLCARALKGEENRRLVEAVQYQLFYFSAELASDSADAPAANRRQIEEDDISALERAVDRCMAQLPPVRAFVLPGVSEAGSRLHMARTLARRAERRLVELSEGTPVRQTLLQYLNRLSDCLYALAQDEDRLENIDRLAHTVMTRYLAALQANGAASVAEAADHEASPVTPSRSAPPGLFACYAPPPADRQRGASTPDRASAAEAGLTFDEIQQLTAAAVRAAQRISLAVVIAIVDSHGNPIITYRMPNALLVSSELAPKKAWTSVALKAATHTLSASVQPGAQLYQLEASTQGKVVSFGGGYPLWRDGQLLGGLGISGGSVAQDQDIALAALSALSLRNE